MEFYEDNTIKSKIYPPNYIVRVENSWSIIIITYDEYIFFINDIIQWV